MSLIDVAIPGLIGLFFAARPQAAYRPSGDPLVDAVKHRRMRAVGLVLMAVAVAYLLIGLLER